MEALNSGALLTATVEKGEGESSPSEGDLVLTRHVHVPSLLFIECRMVNLLAQVEKLII